MRKTFLIILISIFIAIPLFTYGVDNNIERKPAPQVEYIEDIEKNGETDIVYEIEEDEKARVIKKLDEEDIGTSYHSSLYIAAGALVVVLGVILVIRNKRRKK